MSDIAERLTRAQSEPVHPLRKALYAGAALLFTALLWAQFLGQPDYAFTTILFADQDLLCGFAIVATLLVLGRWADSLPQPRTFSLQPGTSTAILSFLLAALSLAGASLVFFGYGLTRDEAMAIFDAVILSGGRLAATVPPEWRPYTDALEPEFLFRFAGGDAWASLYLPGNAALRALAGLVADPAWTGPALILLAAWATWSSARMLWPGRPDAALVATVLVVTAPQVVITGMTAYAMTAHLALNMLWLRLFLQNTRTSHAGAIATGWLATGLHQIIFHPLFVAPFIIQLLTERRYKLAAAYVASYAGIGLFWLSYGRILMSLCGLSPADPAAAGNAVASALSLLSNFSIFGLNTMLKNLLRLATWQNIALVPLLALALAYRKKMPAVLVSLVAGFALTLLAATLLMPYQGHGWGYRYLHGLIGSAALVAAFGWIALTDELPASRRTAGNIIFHATLASLLVLLPVRAAQARAFTAPYAQSYELIRSAKDDVVIVDRTGMMFAVDLVRNDPHLRNVPKVLDLASLTEDQILSLCRTYRVGIFDRKAGTALNIPTYEMETDADARRRAKRAFLDRNGCGELIEPR